MLKKTFLITLLASIFLLLPHKSNAEGRDRIRIVGSSTVYPFATVVAEEFGKKNPFKTPIVESTGTGGGFKLFCSGVGDDFPDLTNASREIKESEVNLCKSNGVNSVTEIQLGYDGIVIANSKESEQLNVTKKELFLALAKRVEKDGILVDNFYNNWSDINPQLPDIKIEVYGPPPTSGTRDAFVEIVMENACLDIEAFKAAFPDEDVRKKQCHQIREDGKYIESGENDNLIVQKLKNNPKSFGIFGFSFLEENTDQLQGSKVDGTLPEYEDIASGQYSVSRSLFVYLKDGNLATTKGLKEFVKELVSEDAMSPEGYLAMKGLVSLRESEVEALRAKVLPKVQ